MITLSKRFVQSTSATILFVTVFVLLSMIWPIIITLFLGVFLLLRACSAEQQPAALWLPEVGHVPIAVAL